MSVTPAAGLARRVDRAILTATVVFGGVGLAGLLLFCLALHRGHGASASLIYGVSLVTCALCSFLYNTSGETAPRAVLRYLDHAAIFLLIAGTYTPFAATGIAGPLGGSLLGWVWGLALLGMLLKLALPAAFDRVFVALYLALGWLFLSALGEVVQMIPVPALGLLAAGGIAYTVGALIFARDIGHWTDPVWHGCVLAGIVAHFLAVLAFLAAAPLA
jgi:hemolysin III